MYAFLYDEINKSTQSGTEKYSCLPELKTVTTQLINENYCLIKKGIPEIAETGIERILNTPWMEDLLNQQIFPAWIFLNFITG